MHHAFKLGEETYAVELSRTASGYCLHLDDHSIAADLQTGADGQSWLVVDDQRYEVAIAVHGDEVFVHLDGETHALSYRHPLDRLAAEAGGAGQDQVLAPMPGSVIQIAVKAGETVTTGQALLVMESMKMETTITAPRDGVIRELMFEVGQTFDRDAALLSLEPLEGGE